MKTKFEKEFEHSIRCTWRKLVNAGRVSNDDFGRFLGWIADNGGWTLAQNKLAQFR